jgi:hypothetical protein
MYKPLPFSFCWFCNRARFAATSIADGNLANWLTRDKKDVAQKVAIQEPGKPIANAKRTLQGCQ